MSKALPETPTAGAYVRTPLMYFLFPGIPLHPFFDTNKSGIVQPCGEKTNTGISINLIRAIYKYFFFFIYLILEIRVYKNEEKKSTFVR
ncbi:MAG: hypothetical protein BGN96_10645 [Bacteroidales bacterium 45-6]|nr:MAG: hypothetical protein BGN96_10645 [Bacteroidales bacterium 45-6]